MSTTFITPRRIFTYIYSLAVIHSFFLVCVKALYKPAHSGFVLQTFSLFLTTLKTTSLLNAFSVGSIDIRRLKQ